MLVGQYVDDAIILAGGSGDTVHRHTLHTYTRPSQTIRTEVQHTDSQTRIKWSQATQRVYTQEKDECDHCDEWHAAPQKHPRMCSLGGSNRLLMQTPRSTHAHRSRKRSRLLQGPYFIILVNICPATTITYVLRGYNYSGLTWHSFSNRAPL